MLLLCRYTGIRFDGAMRSCYAGTGRYEGRSQPLSFDHYEALTGPVDYYRRGNGYNTSFDPRVPRFPGKASFQLIQLISGSCGATLTFGTLDPRWPGSPSTRRSDPLNRYCSLRKCDQVRAPLPVSGHMDFYCVGFIKPLELWNRVQ